MIVTGSNLHLSSSHSYLEYQRRHESLTMWKDGAEGRRQLTLESSSEQLRMDASTSSLAFTQQAPRLQPPPARQAETTSPAQIEATDADATVEYAGDLQVTILKLLVEKLTGRRLELFDARAMNHGKAVELPPEQASRGDARQGWGAVYHAEETTLEQESTQFSAQGIVRTADGREITLSVELNMSREFISHTSLTVRAGDALKDPLVINFAGNAAELTRTKFAFDIDADGRMDQIAFVGPDSGFLALDRNGDGVINDGRELFGALSGNGFADLAAYDSDGNGWIDEADAIFARLLIWSRDGEGNDRLEGLLERNVGAIYLGQAATPFSLKDNDNALLGVVRASGVYLKEDGGVGTVQQLDLVV
ncbi:FG-GAP repeat domain-containing protein [Sulfurivermis fontis]|uniref:FG-GAP repeat domain-containing protein n=1 Tax=Sulfurivermis fontis TaxID=1972068 RepID=UPI000FD92A58|nr:VCBS repeat-containing protein [Sulfurivermis fontis]